MENDYEREVRARQWKESQGEDVMHWQEKQVSKKDSLCIRTVKCYGLYLRQKVSWTTR